MRRRAPVAASSRSNVSYDNTNCLMAKSTKRLLICVDNTGYRVSLECRKIYAAIPDAHAESLGQVRVIDESGEDYLYPKKAFVEVALPQSVRRAVLDAAV
jgi:hypothetical protein